MSDPKHTVEFFLGEINQKVDRLLAVAADHEPRIKKNEEWRVRSIGWIAGASTVGGFVASVVFHFLK